MTSALATRLCGSDDLYDGRGPLHSINFITCHDGFTLARPRLLQPQAQRGQRRGQPRRQRRQLELELRRRGADRRPRRSSRSARRQARNLMATLLLSQGVPMLLGGDEFLRTQRGNNNAWCQDNEIELGRLDAGRAERRLPPVRPRDDRPAQGAPGPAAADVLHGRPRRADRPTSSGTAWSRPGPTSRPRSQALAFALDGRRCDRPGVDRPRLLRRDERRRPSRSSSGSRRRRRAAPGGGSSTRRCPRPTTSSSDDEGPRDPGPALLPGARPTP